MVKILMFSKPSPPLLVLLSIVILLLSAPTQLLCDQEIEDYDHDSHAAASEPDVDLTDKFPSGSYGSPLYGAPSTFVVEQQVGAPVVQVPIPYAHALKGLKFSQGSPYGYGSLGPGWGWPPQFGLGGPGAGWGLPFPPPVVIPFNFPQPGWGWPGPGAFRR